MFKWSSYGAYAGYVTKSAWLQTNTILARAGSKEKYRNYMHSYVTRGENPDEYETLKGRLAIGSVAFIDKMKKKAGNVSTEHTGYTSVQRNVSLGKIVSVVESEKGEKWDEFRGRHGDWGLPLFFYLARKRSGCTLAELGDRAGGMKYKAVSIAITRLNKKLETDKHLARIVKRCINQL